MNARLKLLHRLSMRLQQLRALLLPSLQLRIAMAMCGRNNFFTLGVQLFHAASYMRRFSRNLLLLLACCAASRNELPSGGSILRHAVQRYNTERFPVALRLLLGSADRPVHHRSGVYGCNVEVGAAPVAFFGLRVHLSHSSIESTFEHDQVLQGQFKKVTKTFSTRKNHQHPDTTPNNAANLHLGKVTACACGRGAADGVCKAAEERLRSDC
jgi:hypothetical protein